MVPEHQKKESQKTKPPQKNAAAKKGQADERAVGQANF